MNHSARRERIGVTEMDLKSDKEVGLEHFGIGVTIAVHQLDGTEPDLIEALNM